MPKCRHCINDGVHETVYGYWLCAFHLLEFVNKVIAERELELV